MWLYTCVGNGYVIVGPCFGWGLGLNLNFHPIWLQVLTQNEGIEVERGLTEEEKLALGNFHERVGESIISIRALDLWIKIFFMFPRTVRFKMTTMSSKISNSKILLLLSA